MLLNLSWIKYYSMVYQMTKIKYSNNDLDKVYQYIYIYKQCWKMSELNSTSAINSSNLFSV